MATRNSISWAEAQTGSIEIPDRNPSAVDRPIWFRQETAVESFSETHIITSIQLSPPTSTSHELNLDVVKVAVRQLRFDHPAIASTHSKLSATPRQAVFAYEVPGSESDVDAWLSEVVLDKSDVLSSSDGDLEKAIAAIRYDLGKPVSFGRSLFLLHYIAAPSPSGQHGLVFYLSHTVFDAVGCFQIMDLCVSRIADALATGGIRKPSFWGDETSRLPPALVDSARISRSAEKIPEDDGMLRKVKKVLQALPSVHKLPMPSLPSTPQATGLFTPILPSGVVANLRAAARAHESTVTAVLVAAMALASVRVSPPTATTNATLPFPYFPVDIRPLACDDRYDRFQWKVRLSIGFNSYAAYDLGRFVRSTNNDGDDPRRLAEDIWVLSNEVREQMEGQKKHMERMPVWLDDMLTILHTTPMSSHAGERTGWFPLISSIGIMDNYLARSHPVATGGQLIVSSPRLSPLNHIPFSDCLVALHAFTWDGELMCAFTFPESVMGAARDQKEDGIVLKYINQFMHILDVVSQSK